MHNTTNEMLDIAVSKNQIEHALMIFDALIRTIEELVLLSVSIRTSTIGMADQNRAPMFRSVVE